MIPPESFVRTPSGQSTYASFTNRLVVWVEGADDVLPFSEIARSINLPCTIKDAGGKPRCITLAAEVSKSNDCIIIMDGDFDTVNMFNIRSGSIITLGRYSIENYFCNHQSAAECIHLLSGASIDRTSAAEQVQTAFGRLARLFRAIVVLDYAMHLDGADRSVVPEAYEQLISGKGKNRRIDTKRIHSISRLARSRTSSASRLRSVASLRQRADFAEAYVRGHLLLSCMRGVVQEILKKHGSTPSFDHCTLWALITPFVCNTSTHPDYMHLVQELKNAANVVAGNLS